MDFIIGMFLIVFALIMLINFASISVTDSPSVSGQCAMGSGWFGSSMPTGAMAIPTTTKVNLNGAKRDNIVTQKMGYDYANYFFF